jgi:hypothetical protein
MSAQELRDLLEAELAELSDNDDDSVDDFSSTIELTYDSNIFENKQLLNEFCNDEENEEWRHLLESSAMAEKRFLGLETSLISNFQPLSQALHQHSKPRNDSALVPIKLIEIGLELISHEAGASADTPIDTSRTKGFDSPEKESRDDTDMKNDIELDIEKNAKKDVEHDLRYDLEQDLLLMAELRDVIDHMIEAVERSAPIIPSLQLEMKPIFIDWSSLPQMLLDDENDSTDNQITLEDDSIINSVSAPSATARDSNVDEINRQHALRRQQELEKVEGKLRLDGEIAEQNMMERKKIVNRKKLAMEEELKVFKKEQALVSLVRVRVRVRVSVKFRD